MLREKVRALKSSGLSRQEIADSLGITLYEVNRGLYYNNYAQYVNSKLVFRFIDSTYPDMLKSDMADLIGKNDKVIHAYRNQKTLTLRVADELLTALDLNYLLSTGDIPVYNNRKLVPDEN